MNGIQTSSVLRLYVAYWGMAFALGGCTAQVPSEVPYHRDPATPSQASLQAISQVDGTSLTRKQAFNEKGEGSSTFFLEGSPFSGWAYQVFPDTDHRFRYTLYRGGQALWQVGYYDNGQLDHDFHLKEGKTWGSERMWNKDGSLYIDYFYAEPGKMDGLQHRWHGNGVLAREGLYRKGVQVYEVKFDQNGMVVERAGEVPGKWKRPFPED